MKYAISTFLKLNEDIRLGGPLLRDMVRSPEISNVQDFIEKVVDKMGESARTVVPIVTPLVLRCNLKVVYLDVADKEKTFSIIPYKSKTNGYDFKLEDDLDFHDSTLYLLLKPGHYDLLLQTKSDYDHEFLKLMKTPVTKEVAEEIKNMQSFIEPEDYCSTPCCNTLHKTQVLMRDLKNPKHKHKREGDKIFITTRCCEAKKPLDIFKGCLASGQYEEVMEEFQDDHSEQSTGRTIVMSCCRKECKILEIITIHKELNLNSNEIQCPNCKRKIDIEKSKIPKKVYYMIQNQDFCNICEKKLESEDPSISCQCTRKYHKTCLKGHQLSNNKRCDCGESIIELKKKVKMMYSSHRCIICQKKKEIYQMLRCKHGFCLECFLDYIDDKKSIERAGNKYYCSKCNKKKLLGIYLFYWSRGDNNELLWEKDESGGAS